MAAGLTKIKPRLKQTSKQKIKSKCPNINSLLLVVTCRRPSNQRNVAGYEQHMRQDDAT